MAKKNIQALIAQVATHDDFGQFRFIKKDDGEIWFVAKDVCKFLGIKNHKDAVSRLDDDEKDEVGITDPIGRVQKTLIVNESGLYSLVFQSRKPEAKKFRKWVTSEVLPSIRKYGYYVMPSQRVIEVNKEELKYLQEKYPNLEIKKFIVDWVENEELKNGEGKVVMTYEVCLGDF